MQEGRQVETDKRDTRTRSILIGLAFYGVVFALAFLNFWTQLQFVGGRGTTLIQHLRFAKKMREEGAHVFHGLFFKAVNLLAAMGLTPELAAVLFLAACVTVTAFFSVRMLRPLLREHYSESALYGITFSTLIATAIYIPFFNEHVYLGQWGANVYHNSTVTTVKAFMVPIFVLVASLMHLQQPFQSLPKVLATSLLLLISLYAKPSLLMVLAPATGILILVRERSFSSRLFLPIALFAPGVLGVLSQYVSAYNADASLFAGRETVIAPFQVWSEWSLSVPVSILLATAFPLGVILVTWRTVAKNPNLSFACATWASGFLMAAMLAEKKMDTGEILKSANWFGPYLLANHLLFLAATGTFFLWRKTVPRSTKTRLQDAALLFLLLAHIISGIAYLVRLRYVVVSFA